MCGARAPSTIQSPNTAAYDRLLNAQIAAMGAMQSSAVQAGQQQLNRLLLEEQSALSTLRDLRIERANNSAADTARMLAVLGPPPPERSAKAPTLGANRAAPAGTGKRQLRADMRRPTAGPGSGLNIP